MVYLINKETNEAINEFNNVIYWDDNSVTYLNGGYEGKIYSGENEYFTDNYEITEYNEETDNDTSN